MDAQARESRLSHLVGEERLLGARVLDLAVRAMEAGEPIATRFLDPAEQLVARGVLGDLGLRIRAEGGVVPAERVRLLLYPEYLLDELLPESVVRAIEITCGGELRHPDVLGALLGLGIERDRLGDIVISGEQAYAIVAPEVAPLVVNGLGRVGNREVQAAEVDPEQIDTGERRVKEIRTTVASLRLDAVASSGYAVSRTRVVRDIKAGRLKLNWKPVESPAHVVKVGDVISMRGRGRVEVAESSGQTRKGRIGLLLRRVY